MITFTYQGYMSQEAQNFFGDNIIQEQRDGMAVMGFWVKTQDGNTHMLSKGQQYTKDEKGIYPLAEY